MLALGGGVEMVVEVMVVGVVVVVVGVVRLVRGWGGVMEIGFCSCDWKTPVQPPCGHPVAMEGWRRLTTTASHLLLRPPPQLTPALRPRCVSLWAGITALDCTTVQCTMYL